MSLPMIGYNRYHPNLKVQVRDSKKIYAVDTGLRNANASSPQEDIGKLAENACYLELRRRQKDISYFKEEGEVNFVVTEFAKPTQAIQVCYSNLDDPKTFQRETVALGLMGKMIQILVPLVFLFFWG